MTAEFSPSDFAPPESEGELRARLAEDRRQLAEVRGQLAHTRAVLDDRLRGEGRDTFLCAHMTPSGKASNLFLIQADVSRELLEKIATTHGPSFAIVGMATLTTEAKVPTLSVFIRREFDKFNLDELAKILPDDVVEELKMSHMTFESEARSRAHARETQERDALRARVAELEKLLAEKSK